MPFGVSKLRLEMGEEAWKEREKQMARERKARYYEKNREMILEKNREYNRIYREKAKESVKQEPKTEKPGKRENQKNDVESANVKKAVCLNCLWGAKELIYNRITGKGLPDGKIYCICCGCSEYQEIMDGMHRDCLKFEWRKVSHYEKKGRTGVNI